MTITELADSYIRRGKIEVLYAGEALAQPANVSEIEVPMLIVYFPKTFLKKYMEEKEEKNIYPKSFYPILGNLWEEVKEQFKGKGLKAKDDERNINSVDDVLEELSKEPYSVVWYHVTDKGMQIKIKGAYDHYWDEDEWETEPSQ